MFMNPMPSQSWYDVFYRTQFWEIKSTKKGATSALVNRYQWEKELHRAQQLHEFLTGFASDLSAGYLLEIGCAYGLIASSLARRLGLTAAGVEPSEAARHFAEQHCGVRIVAETAGQLSDWQPDMPLRLVVMSHVFENIVDPTATLVLLREKLAPHGLLVIETPNPQWRTAVSIYHPYVYSKHAINAISRRAGFDVLKYEASGRPLTRSLPLFQRILLRPSTSGVGTSVIQEGRDTAFPLRRRLGLATHYAWKRLGRPGAVPLSLDDIDHELLAELERRSDQPR
jgi:2-polyprenyl-3-methyl-5-hydroxy-6-metoxy-1,4-benzoquinol methylase